MMAPIDGADALSGEAKSQTLQANRKVPQTGNIAKGVAADTVHEFQHPLLRCSRTGNPSRDTPSRTEALNAKVRG